MFFYKRKKKSINFEDIRISLPLFESENCPELVKNCAESS